MVCTRDRPRTEEGASKQSARSAYSEWNEVSECETSSIKPVYIQNFTERERETHGDNIVLPKTMYTKKMSDVHAKCRGCSPLGNDE